MRIICKAPVRIDFAGAWTDCEPFYGPFGGATLNAAINQYVTGELVEAEGVLRVSYASQVPAGSGLGTSATMNVVWLAMARRLPVAGLEDRKEIAELAYRIENTLGIIGGKQDQYASAVGAINLFEFHRDRTEVHPVALEPEAFRELQDRMVLCYTGKSRLSSNIHENVWGNFRKGRKETVDALFVLRDSAWEAREALVGGDWGRFGSILSAQHACMKDLDASTTNAMIEEIFARTSEWFLGAKPCGAGGGGCLMILARDSQARPRIETELRALGATLIPFAFDTEGLTVEMRDNDR